MKLIQQKVYGKLWEQGEERALWLMGKDAAATVADSRAFYLRYALVRRGPEDHLFPAFLLDDWGTEIGKLEFYNWLNEHGEAFPRGDIFGWEATGQETQFFVRELELYMRYPVYIAGARDTLVQDARELAHIVLQDETVPEQTRVKCPDSIPAPLKSGRIKWWKSPQSKMSKFSFPPI